MFQNLIKYKIVAGVTLERYVISKDMFWYRSTGSNFDLIFVEENSHSEYILRISKEFYISNLKESKRQIYCKHHCQLSI